MGPVGIAQLSGGAARLGWIPLLTLMAMISLNLGILNLLPIPMLDGGHIFIMALEGAARRDFSLRVKERLLDRRLRAHHDADGHRHLQRPDAHRVDSSASCRGGEIALRGSASGLRSPESCDASGFALDRSL